MRTHYQNMIQNLKRTLAFDSGIWPLGLLWSCKEYAPNDKAKIDGVFEAVSEMFKLTAGHDLPPTLTHII